jgi:hypothetical protein
MTMATPERTSEEPLRGGGSSPAPTRAYSQTERALKDESMPHPIERYVNVHTVLGGTFPPDVHRLAFLTDIPGTHQVWALNVSPLRHPPRREETHNRLDA